MRKGAKHSITSRDKISKSQQKRWDNLPPKAIPADLGENDNIKNPPTHIIEVNGRWVLKPEFCKHKNSYLFSGHIICSDCPLDI